VIGSLSNDAQARGYPVETRVGSLHLILRLNISGTQGDTWWGRSLTVANARSQRFPRGFRGSRAISNEKSASRQRSVGYRQRVSR